AAGRARGCLRGAKSSLRRPHAPRPARRGPPLTSAHQFEALGFPAPFPFGELHGAGRRQGLRPVGGRRAEGAAAEAAAAVAALAALALVTRQRERQDQGCPEWTGFRHHICFHLSWLIMIIRSMLLFQESYENIHCKKRDHSSCFDTKETP
ncbi:unnamed protein product, partial [Gulo gulo]